MNRNRHSSSKADARVRPQDQLSAPAGSSLAGRGHWPPTSRRKFLAGSLPAAAGLGLAATWAAPPGTDPPPGADSQPVFKLVPIGRVEKAGGRTRLRIFEAYADGLLGLEQWSHVHVLYWFDKNDTPQQRRILRVHPRADRQNPLTGVFACRAPARPNLIALSVCKILSVEGNLVAVDDLDAFDGTPLLDLKPFTPADAPSREVRVPAWAGPTKQDK